MTLAPWSIVTNFAALFRFCALRCVAVYALVVLFAVTLISPFLTLWSWTALLLWRSLLACGLLSTWGTVVAALGALRTFLWRSLLPRLTVLGAIIAALSTLRAFVASRCTILLHAAITGFAATVAIIASVVGAWAIAIATRLAAFIYWCGWLFCRLGKHRFQPDH